MAKKKASSDKRRRTTSQTLGNFQRVIESSRNGENLKRIEGIGPKLEAELKKNGIKTYKQLASASQAKLKRVIADAGPRFRLHDPTTWSKQAALAANDDWDELRTYQNQRDGGRNKTEHASKQQSITVALTGLDGGEYRTGQPFKIERILTHEEAEQEYKTRKDEIDRQFVEAHKTIAKLLAAWNNKTRKPPRSGKGNETHCEQMCRLIDNGNVTAVSARYRTKFGQPVSPLHVVIGVNVDRKLEEANLRTRKRAKDILPKQYEGFDIKVVEGTFYLLSGLNGVLLRGAREPANPLPFDQAVVGGIPISPVNSPTDFGTLGVVHKEGSTFIGLTCQHVAKGSPGDAILQLGSGGLMRGFAEIVKVVLPANRDNGVTESIDCASIKINTQPGPPPIIAPPDGTWTRGISHAMGTHPGVGNTTPLLFANRELEPDDCDLPLWKFGNGTGELLQGKISILRHDLVMVNQPGSGTLGYRNNFTMHRVDSGRPFVAPGDSGSLLVLEARANFGGTVQPVYVAVGVLFAALENSSIGLACSMVNVIKGLDLGSSLAARLTKRWYKR